MEFKKYVNDKQVIFLNIVLLLMTLFVVLLVVLRVDTTQSVAILRNNTTEGLGGFDRAESSALYQFAVIAVVVCVAHSLMAMRVRIERRPLAVFALTLGIVVQIFLATVTTAILSLHR